jgi:hypothetical protein
MRVTYALGQMVDKDGILIATLALLHPLTNAYLAGMVNVNTRSLTKVFIHPGCWLIAKRILSCYISINGKYISVFLECLIQL